MATGAEMKAALVLSFEDKLSAGLDKLQKNLAQLKKLGEQQTLGKLATGFEDIQRTITATRDLAGELRGVGSAAKSAYADLKMMTSAVSRVGFSQRGFTANDAAMLWGGSRVATREIPRASPGMSGMMAGLGGLGAGYIGLSSARSYATIEDLARRSAITKGLSGAALNADTARLVGLFQRDALATGQSSQAIGETYLDLAGYGIVPAEVERLLPIHSRVATAYDIAPEVLSPATAALNQNLGIGDTDMAGALAAMATATKEGRFKVEDFARYLPSLTGDFAKLHLTGRGAANELFAALETVMKNAADPGSGAANFKDFINYLTSPTGARAFYLQTKGMSVPTKALIERYHIDRINIPDLLENARLTGIDPITAVIGTLQKKLAGLPPDVMAEILGGWFHNQQARDAALALIQHQGEFQGMQQQLGGVDAGTLERDFQSRMAGTAVQMKLLDEELTQLNQHLGVGLMPVVRTLVHGLDDLGAGITWLNQIFPGLGDDVVGMAGGAIGLVGALAGIQLALPLLKGVFETALLLPARELKTVLIEAGNVLGIDMVAALNTAGVAMDAFTTKTMANPLIRTGMLAFMMYQSLHDKMNQGVPIDTMSPRQRQLEGIMPTGPGTYERADQEWIEHHGPGMNLPTNGRLLDSGAGEPVPVPAAGSPLGTIYVGVDPDSGQIHITRTDSGLVHLVPIPGAGPNPGQTLGRP